MVLLVLRQRFVLDTTALTDVHMREIEGYRNLCEGMLAVLDLIAEARLKLGISCYIPYPTVYNEAKSFAKRYECGEEIITKIDTWLVKKTPARYEVKIPAEIFYEYVETMRERINKGMVISEDALWELSSAILSIDPEELVNMRREDLERNIIGPIIGKFREKYRTATRHGVLDSAPDIDVLLLAKELDAAVVASDIGIQKWAQRIGLRFLDAASFPRMIKEYLKKAEMIR